MKFKFKEVVLLSGAVAVLSAAPGQAAQVNWNGWAFDYEVGINNDGLALKNVKYQNHTLLKKVGLPAISLENVTVGGWENQCTQPATDVIFPQITAMPWASNATISQREITKFGRQWLEIAVYLEFPALTPDGLTSAPREYYQAYYLSQDGVFDAHLFTRGGWTCSKNERIPHWRVDLDIDGPASDLIEVNPGGSNLTFSAKPTEFTAAARQGSYRVRDLVTNNSATITMAGLNFAHPDGTPTQPTSETAHTYDNSWISSWTNSSVLYKAAEDVALATAQQNTTGTTPSYALTPETGFVNGESINDIDVVNWFYGVISPLVDFSRIMLPDDRTQWYTNSISITPSWPQTLPDVIVDDISYDYQGRYTVTVRNLGAATPAGKSVGVGIFVDGVYRTYVSTTGLLPGAVRTITSTELGRYVIQPGEHVINAKADDINRFAETLETNNTLDKPVSVTGPTVTITSPARNSTVSGAAVVLSARKTDPAGERYRLNFYIDGQLISSKWSAPYAITWDSSTVAPGLHAFTVLSTNAFGNLVGSGDNVVFNVVADSAAFRPDFAVTSLSYANGQFAATTKNIGAGAIPAGVQIGLSYYVDGKYVSWSTANAPMAADESRTVNSLSSYAIPAGSHSIKVVADDQGSVMESNETNNVLSKTIN